MEPTESAAPDSRLRLRRMSGAWTGILPDRTQSFHRGLAPPPPGELGSAALAVGPYPACTAPELHRRARSRSARLRDPERAHVLARAARGRGRVGRIRPRRRLLPGVRRRATRSSRPAPSAGRSRVLTGIIVGHLVALGRARWWGGTGSGAALTLAVLLLYGWVPAGMVSLTVVVLVGIARRNRWRQGVLHGAVDILGIGAGALVLAVVRTRARPSRRPWSPEHLDALHRPPGGAGRGRLSRGHPRPALVPARAAAAAACPPSPVPPWSDRASSRSRCSASRR